MSFAKKASDHIPYAKDQGMDYLVAASVAGQGIQAKAVAQAGGAPFTFTFEDQDLKKMANADYVVLVNGETAGRVNVDENTKSAEGFDILGGADTEVLNVIVVGVIEGTSAE